MMEGDDVTLASAARYLIDGGEEDAASVLLSCTLRWWPSGDSYFEGDEVHDALHVSLTGPRAAYDVLMTSEHEITLAIRHAIEAVLCDKSYIRHFSAHVETIDIDENWREELVKIARGKGVHNQAAQGKQLYVWKNLGFRSKSEVRIAEALDRAGAFFLPNCRGRVGPTSRRENREADFLVCWDGRWGILEVDGEPFHPPSRTSEDHARDRLFKECGVLVVEHFDATECFNQADVVVKRFLKLLERASK